MNHFERVIRIYARRPEPFTRDEVDRFLALMHAVDNLDDKSLAASSIRKRTREIEKETEPAAIERQMRDFLSFLTEALTRQSYQDEDKTVYFTHWGIGKTALSGADVIGICPVCGRRGAIALPEEEYAFAGQTVHVAKPFFMGLDVLESCDWATKETFRKPKGA